MTRRRVWTHVGMAAIAGAFVLGAWWTRPTPIPLPSEFVASKQPVPAEYVDDARCAECHPEVAAKFATSGMGRAFNTWKDAEPIEDRTEGIGPTLSLGDLHYQVVIDRGRMFQREFRIVDGREIELNRREAIYVLGSGTKGRGYLAAVNGYLTAMPLSWYSSRKAWDFSPGYRAHNYRFDRRITRGCMSCHNAVVGFLPGTLNGYVEPLPAGLGCQRCHGPSAGHVAFHENSQGGRDPMVRITRLEPRLQNDVCLQCHLLGETSLARGDCGAFRPGDRIADCRADYFKVRDASAFEAVGHGPRSMASKCYTASGGKMTCVVCHDPHLPAAGVSRAVYNQRCNDCHQSVLCKRTLNANETARQGDCVSCHMPTRKADDIPHASSTDHLIHVPGRPLSAPIAIPKDPQAKMVAWALDPTPIENAVAESRHASAHGSLEELDAAQRKLEGLLRASQGRHADAWLALTRGYVDMGDFVKAKDAGARAVTADPDSTAAVEVYAFAMGRMGEFAAQAEALERVLQKKPWFNTSDANLMEALARSRGEFRAFELYDRYVQFHPPSVEALLQLGEMKRRTNAPTREAAAFLQKARSADGARAEPHMALSRLALSEENHTAAVLHAEAASLRAPHNPAAHALLAACHAITGNREAARAAAQKTLSLEPNNAAAGEVLRELDRGRPSSIGKRK
jgi:tetratricopeptide (TPR) repeat protein